MVYTSKENVPDHNKSISNKGDSKLERDSRESEIPIVIIIASGDRDSPKSAEGDDGSGVVFDGGNGDCRERRRRLREPLKTTKQRTKEGIHCSWSSLHAF